MRFIDKQNTVPSDWEEWFTITNENGKKQRTYDYDLIQHRKPVIGSAIQLLMTSQPVRIQQVCFLKLQL